MNDTKESKTEEVRAEVGEERNEVSRKTWSAPHLSVHRIDDITYGTLSSARIDGGNFFS